MCIQTCCTNTCAFWVTTAGSIWYNRKVTPILFFFRTETEYHVGKWMLSGNVSLNQHLVKSMDHAVISVEGQEVVLGYQQARAEASAFVAARYRPVERLGLSLTLREDIYGKKATPPIPRSLLSTLSHAKKSTCKNFCHTQLPLPHTQRSLFYAGRQPQAATGTRRIF